MFIPKAHIIIIDGPKGAGRKMFAFELALALLYNAQRTAIMLTPDSPLHQAIKKRVAMLPQLLSPAIITRENFYNEANKFKYFRSEGESINKRLCEKSAIVNTNIVIAGEISNELDNLYTGLTEVQMEEMMLSDNKKEETQNRIKDRLVGVELRETYWEKRKYSTELGADKDKTAFYCYQLSRVDRKKHDTIINEMFERELRKIKNDQVKEEIKDQVKKNAEEMNVEIKD